MICKENDHIQQIVYYTYYYITYLLENSFKVQRILFCAFWNEFSHQHQHQQSIIFNAQFALFWCKLIKRKFHHWLNIPKLYNERHLLYFIVPRGN